MRIFADDDPLVLAGTYDVEGYKPGERARIEKARRRQEAEDDRRLASIKGQLPLFREERLK